MTSQSEQPGSLWRWVGGFLLAVGFAVAGWFMSASEAAGLARSGESLIALGAVGAFVAFLKVTGHLMRQRN